MDDTDPDANPYPGLRPFQAEETHLFFGRDEQRIELLHRLGGTRFLAIVGTSGSGKSSLVRAGLLPGLHGGFMAGPSDVWRIADLRPGTDAIGNLARALDAPGVLRERPLAEGEPSFTQATLRRTGLGLVDAVREARLPASDKVLVLVDQFEELFRAIEVADRPQSSDDASAFVKLLLEAAAQSELPIYVVLTMRSDFLGECARFRGLPEAINDGQYLVPRLTPDQRIEAITGPAAVFGVSLSPTLVNRLMNDVGDNPDELPILQHALMRTWQRWRQSPAEPALPTQIALADYEGIGGMQQALSLHADAIVDGLLAGCAPDVAARRLRLVEKLFKCLAGTGAGGTVVRRLAPLQEVADVAGAPVAEVAEVVDAFRAPGNCFLMPPAGEVLAPGRYLDISHESLIRNWTRMTHWVAEEAESARVYERLSTTALLHAKNQAGLWHQPDLGVALDWRQRQQPNPAWARRYNAAFVQAMDFLDKSQSRAQQAEDKRTRRRRIWTFSLSLLFLAMATLALAGSRQELERIQAMRAEAGQVLADLGTLRAILALMTPGAARGTAAETKAACTRVAALAEPPERHARLLKKLCATGAVAGDDERRLLAVYRPIVEGDWGAAAVEAAKLGDADGRDETQTLFDRFVKTRLLDDRRERRFLLELQGLGETATAEQRERAAALARPVHRRIAQALAGVPPELNDQERLLLDIYKNAEAAGSKADGDSERDSGRVHIDELMQMPGGRPYAELGRLALNPESKLVEMFELSASYLRDYYWSVLVFMVWPVWRLRRLLQRRQGAQIAARPNSLRLLLAAAVDITIAVAAGIVAATFVGSAVAIGRLLIAGASGRQDGETAGILAGLSVGIVCLLGRDVLRLRVRRSIGKVLFDLRPLRTDAAEPGALTWAVSARRNAVLPGLLLTVYLPLLMDSIVGALVMAVVGLGLAVLTLVLRLRGLPTLGERWSKTRVVDADSAESRAARP